MNLNSTVHEGLVDRAWRSAAARLQRYASRSERRVLDRQLAHLDLDGVRDVHTWTLPAELVALYRLAAACPAGANIVEFGSYLGASTCYLAAGAARLGGRITAVDLWNNETVGGDRDTFAEFQRHTAGAAHLITPLRKRTQELTPADIPTPVDLAFLDADHSYESTKADALFIAPLMAREGVIAFHDTTAFAGVARALAEMLLTSEWCVGGQVENLTWIRRAKWAPWPLPAENVAPAP